MQDKAHKPQTPGKTATSLPVPVSYDREGAHKATWHMGRRNLMPPAPFLIQLALQYETSEGVRIRRRERRREAQEGYQQALVRRGTIGAPRPRCRAIA